MKTGLIFFIHLSLFTMHVDKVKWIAFIFIIAFSFDYCWLYFFFFYLCLLFGLLIAYYFLLLRLYHFILIPVHLFIAFVFALYRNFHLKPEKCRYHWCYWVKKMISKISWIHYDEPLKSTSDIYHLEFTYFSILIL